MPVDHDAVAVELDVGDGDAVVVDRRPRNDPPQVKPRAQRRIVKPSSVFRADALEETALPVGVPFAGERAGYVDRRLGHPEAPDRFLVGLTVWIEGALGEKLLEQRLGTEFGLWIRRYRRPALGGFALGLEAADPAIGLRLRQGSDRYERLEAEAKLPEGTPLRVFRVLVVRERPLLPGWSLWCRAPASLPLDQAEKVDLGANFERALHGHAFLSCSRADTGTSARC
jgi:hypothetical protein